MRRDSTVKPMTKAMAGQTVPFWVMPTTCAVIAAISRRPK